MEVSSKAVVVIEVSTEKNKYSYTMPIGAPFQEAHDCALEVVKEIIQFAQHAAEAAKKAEEQAKQ